MQQPPAQHPILFRNFRSDAGKETPTSPGGFFFYICLTKKEQTPLNDCPRGFVLQSLYPVGKVSVCLWGHN